MNQTSFDYAVLSDSVAAELESLRAEKQLLAEKMKKTEERLAEISEREEKLARFSESLTDLLTVYSGSTNFQADSSSAENEKLAVIKTSPNNKSDKTVEPDSKSNSHTEEPFAALKSDNNNAQPTTKNNREFDKTKFLEIYPYLINAQQPIHVLAEKLLEYFGKPVKLRDLTRFIVELGYRHHSQNFTNTVHTVLKNKRDRNGSFYFDPQERMWELGYWRSDAITASESTSTNNVIEQNLETIDDNSNQEPTGAFETSAKAKKIKSVLGVRKTNSKIKLIKAAGRNL